MKKINLSKNKRGLSEMISYVLLIVIALALAVGVYAWLVHYMPKDDFKCPEDISLSINTYNCSGKVINLTIENSGFFNIDGFFARGANETGKIPTLMLTSDQTFDVSNGGGTIQGIPGRYEFAEGHSFNTSETRSINLRYNDYNTLTKIQLQPYVINNKKLYICSSITTVDISGC